jgi:pimeloyl-ACP methyl ester carboxylesterase
MVLAADVAPSVVLRREQTRARHPDRSGFAERPDAGRVAWETYGAGDPAIAFVPPWQIVHSRIYKAQIPYLARRHRVIAWDGRGNGRSDRPRDPAVHSTLARAADALAVLDATDTPDAILVALSNASNPSVVLAATVPERVRGIVFICPSTPLVPGRPDRDVPFDEPLPDDVGWHKENIHYWRRDFRGYVEFFIGECFSEPHSTKQIEDGIGYGLETDVESLEATLRTTGIDADRFRALCERITCPTLVIQGSDDRVGSLERGVALADAIPGSDLVVLEDAGHIPNARDPVRVNLLIRDFVASLPPAS